MCPKNGLIQLTRDMYDDPSRKLENGQRSSIVVEEPKRCFSQVVYPNSAVMQHFTEPSIDVELLRENQLRRRQRHLSCYA
jgi:hypothetical protein